MSKERIHAHVSGKVQGVFFRANTRKFAKDLGLNGWVRNLKDGRVEVVAEGEENKLKKLTEFLHEGPPTAKIKDIKIRKETYKDKFKDFRIRY